MILLAAALLPYLNSLSNSFVYDDWTQVVENPYIRNAHHLREIFTTSVWSYRGNDRSTYYRPLMLVAYLACFRVFGAKAWAFHTLNLLLNVLCVVLVFRITERLFRDRSVAMVAALIFALHPVHTEAVDWIAAVTDLELCFFCLLTFWFFLSLAEPAPGRGWGSRAMLYVGMIASFVLALLAKEPAVMLPVVATVFEHGYREDGECTRLGQKAARYAPLWIVAAGYFWLRVALFGHPLTSRVNLALSAEQVIFSAVALVGQYTWKLFWPVRLCAYYPFSANWSAILPWAALGAVVLAACCAFLVLAWRRDRLPTFAVVWFVAMLVPVLDARWMAANVFTERYLYLPSVGFCWLAAWLMVTAWRATTTRRRALRRLLASAAIAVAVPFTARIVTRNRDWRDDLTLYTQTLRLEPGAYWIRNNLGMVYWDRGDASAAEREWREALREAPSAGVVCDNLGLLETARKHYPEAVDYLDRAIQIDPQDTVAHRSLGVAYHEMGRSTDAERELRTAVDVAPLDVKSRNQLGEFYMDRGRFQEAQAEFRRSVAIEASIKGYMDLGLAEWRLGQIGAAESAFKSAESFDLRSSHPHFLLALLYGSSGRTREAEQEYAVGFKIDPHNAQALAAYDKLRSQDPHAQPARP